MMIKEGGRQADRFSTTLLILITKLFSPHFVFCEDQIQFSFAVRQLELRVNSMEVPDPNSSLVHSTQSKYCVTNFFPYFHHFFLKGGHPSQPWQCNPNGEADTYDGYLGYPNPDSASQSISNSNTIVEWRQHQDFVRK